MAKVNIKLLHWRREHKEYCVLRLKWIYGPKKIDMEQWVKDNCSSDCSLYHPPMSYSYFAFEDETEAMAFKLVWS